MKTQKELKLLFEKYFHYSPLLYAGGIDLFVEKKLTEKGRASLISIKDIEKLIKRKDILKLLVEKSKYGDYSSWAYVAAALLNKNPYNHEVMVAVLEALLNISSISEQGIFMWISDVADKLLKYYSDSEQVINTLLEAALNGAKTEYSWRWVFYIVRPIFNKYYDDKKVLNAIYHILYNSNYTDPSVRRDGYLFYENPNVPYEQREAIKKLYNL